jgi:DNA-binding transcriptional MerR regulator
MTHQMDIPSTAIELDVSITTVRRWIKEGKLTAEKVDGKWMVNPAKRDGYPNEKNGHSSGYPNDQTELVEALRAQIEMLTAEIETKNQQLQRRDDQTDSLTEKIDHLTQVVAMAQKNVATLTDQLESSRFLIEELRQKPVWWKRLFGRR